MGRLRARPVVAVVSWAWSRWLAAVALVVVLLIVGHDALRRPRCVAVCGWWLSTQCNVEGREIEVEMVGYWDGSWVP